jgi:transposase
MVQKTMFLVPFPCGADTGESTFAHLMAHCTIKRRLVVCVRFAEPEVKAPVMETTYDPACVPGLLPRRGVEELPPPHEVRGQKNHQHRKGSLLVTFEEGTCAAWWHDLLRAHVAKALACDPRKNALLKVGNKSDRIDSWKLAELLRSNLLQPVYHEDIGVHTVKELARSYITMTSNLTRVMVRLKALYRGWAIPCAGQQVYSLRYRSAWLEKITDGGVRRRAELCYRQLDALLQLQQCGISGGRR